MFFFFVGGLDQRVARVLQRGAGRCVRCGSLSDLVETEKVLKLFFVPVKTWPSNTGPSLSCTNCGLLFPPSLSPPPPPRRCWSCDRVLDPGFRFCPFCGSEI
ncbi:hypothetical protein QJS04_geneDACA017261 [Acorus gramineus]|uniref:Zinc-ribbon 15 domain-containing protein n=1 Tax=Acorus gramineus TaxID=55184 RepID=A0AAV9A2U7_ACOGR|nr:hypothetical protein QJS04_geneDACA017261 [Acorus gramineus]